MDTFTDPNRLNHGCFYNIYDKDGNLIADNAKLEGKPWDGLRFSIKSSSGEITPLFLKKPFVLTFVEIEQPKFTEENAREIMGEIIRIIGNKGFCNYDDLTGIFRKVYEMALLWGHVMRSIKNGTGGHYKLDIEEALQQNGLTMSIVRKDVTANHNGEFCYFVRNGETPECSGPSIPYNSSSGYTLGFSFMSVNFVAYSN